MTIASSTVDCLVIGGGLAGAMVGMRLAEAGRDVLLVEKERSGHHKVCGEFLSPEAVEYLRQAGVDPLRLGAVPVRYLRLSAKSRLIEVALPFRALSVSRCALDSALLLRAAESGCRISRGVPVKGLTRHEDRWIAELGDGSIKHARNVFLATGKHDLRGWGRGPGVHSDLVGFKMLWRLAAAQTEAMREYMELFLFRGGYGGLSLVEGDAANLSLVVRHSTLRELGGWRDLLASMLDENRQIQTRLEGAYALWERPLAVSSIPYGYLAGQACGLWCVGDQAAVIPSFTGDGMSIALHSGALAAEMYLNGESVDQYNRKLHAQLKRGMALATSLSRAMVSFAARQVAPSGLALFPSAIGWIARSTRIPLKALLAAPRARTPSFVRR
jgi:flavin-dependent dehydrogenase